MVTRRTRFAAGTDGPVLPRCSNPGGFEKPRNDRKGVINSVIMIAALIGTVYLISRHTRNLPNSNLGSTGEGEGLEDFMFAHEQHDVQQHDAHHDKHDHLTGSEHYLDAQAHNLADSEIDDDGSIIVKTSDHQAAAAVVDHADAAAAAAETVAQHAAPAMPPAHAVGTHTDSNHQHSSSSNVVADVPHHDDSQHDTDQHAIHDEVHNEVHADAVHADNAASSDDVLPDPAEEPGMPPHNHEHPAHAAAVDIHTPASGLYALSATDIDGHERHLSEFAGRVTLVVNVASHCGYTDVNYKGLQEVYAKYHAHGLEILAFPSNEFGNQEPGTEAEIKEFCASNYHTTFPMFSKVLVNGPQAHPVYQFLKSMLPVDQGGGGGVSDGKDIGWNFYKFLVDREGHPVKLFHQDWHKGVIEHAVYDMLVNPRAHV